MISASDLNGILAVLTEKGVNVFRYKNGPEEMEIVIPGDMSPDVNEDTKNSSGKPRLNLIGFHTDDIETVDDDEQR